MKRGIVVFLFPALMFTQTNEAVEGKILPPLVVAPAAALPNTYLVDGTNTLPFQETSWRRYDVVFFVAVPISFYFVMNILMVKNAYFYGSEGRYLSDTDWNYLYLITFLVPLFTAYHDQVYVRQLSEKNTEMRWSMPLYQKEF
ncbi:MAG: hypothetical protein N2314_01635 [Brevinematales bacterium]|nr:hypothetical protein [Brevinematales bacterium]